MSTKKPQPHNNEDDTRALMLIQRVFNSTLSDNDKLDIIQILCFDPGEYEAIMKIVHKYRGLKRSNKLFELNKRIIALQNDAVSR